MTSKLYVTNYPSDTTEQALRAFFEPCGRVYDVEFLHHTHTGKPLHRACVTMTTPAFATEAMSRLDGASFRGKPLHVTSNVPGAKVVPKVRVTQQFRERANMAYELDCQGATLTLRMFPTEAGDWRMEARSREGEDAFTASSAGASRRAVLDELVRSWNERAPAAGVGVIDPAGLVEALSEVRAV